MHVDPTNASKCGALLWRNSMVRRKDSVPEMQKCPLKMSEAILAVLRLTRKHAPKDFSNEQRELDPMMFEAPERGERFQLKIRSESKTVVDWITSKARQRSVWEAVGSVQ